MASENRAAESWCEVLYVSSNATLDEVAFAYRELAKRLHPDLWTSAPEKQRAMAGARMKSINAAFERAKQDISLREERKAAAASASAKKAAEAATAAKQAEEERKAAAASASAKKAAEQAAAAKQAEEAVANRHKGNRKPDPRGLFTRGLGPSLASVAVILLGGYVISALRTQHASVPDRTIVDSPQPALVSAHPNRGGIMTTLKEAQPAAGKPSGNTESRENVYLEREPTVPDRQMQPKADFSGAIALCTERIRLDPLSVENYVDRGIYYCRMGNLHQAVADLTQAINIAPNRAKAYHNRGVVRVMQGKFDLAIDDFNAAIGLDPAYSVAYTNRDWAVQKKREKEGGTNTANVSRSVPPITVSEALDHDTPIRSAEAYCRQGTDYLKKGDYDKAIAECNEAIRLNPKHADAYCSRGGAYTQKGEHDRAIADCNEAIRLNPKLARAYNNRGLAYMRGDNLEKAITDFTAAIQLDPQFAMAYDNRGIAHKKQGNWDKAEDDFAHAKEFGRKQ